MMPNSLPSTGPGRGALTVRELVEGAPATVTSAWCRQVAAQLLDDIDSRPPTRPHRIIMPDSVLADAAGHAALLASPEDDGEFQPPVTVDLKAIAAVLQFAVSGESPPGGPLLPRVLPAFDEALLGAIDACLYGDRTQRPQSVAAMRAMLGLPQTVPTAVPAAATAAAPVMAAVATPLAGATAASVTAPVIDAEIAAPLPPPAEAVTTSEASAVPPVTSMPAARPPRATRLLLGCLTFVLLGIGGYALYERGRQAGAEAVLAATSAPAPVAALPAPIAPAAQPSDREPAPPVPGDAPAAAADAASVTAVEAITPAAQPAPSVTRPVLASATYQLRIKPWGTIYVDGVKRGISPPMKSLSLTGEHTVRIDNPGFPSRQFTVRPGKDATTRIEHDFD